MRFVSAREKEKAREHKCNLFGADILRIAVDRRDNLRERRDSAIIAQECLRGTSRRLLVMHVKTNGISYSRSA